MRVYGAQIGFLGAWGYAEFPLGRRIVARINAGLDGGIWGGSSIDGATLAIVPVIEAGPRWYYNLDKRALKEKRTDRNAANFLSLPVSYHPGWFTLSNEEGTSINQGITILPTWGIRRNLGRHLNFEVGAGLGYRTEWNDFGYRDNSFAAWIPLRIGF